MAVRTLSSSCFNNNRKPWMKLVSCMNVLCGESIESALMKLFSLKLLLIPTFLHHTITQQRHEKLTKDKKCFDSFRNSLQSRTKDNTVIQKHFPSLTNKEQRKKFTNENKCTDTLVYPLGLPWNQLLTSCKLLSSGFFQQVLKLSWKSFAASTINCRTSSKWPRLTLLHFCTLSPQEQNEHEKVPRCDIGRRHGKKGKNDLCAFYVRPTA